jgi:hypothetical protein
VTDPEPLGGVSGTQLLPFHSNTCPVVAPPWASCVSAMVAEAMSAFTANAKLDTWAASIEIAVVAIAVMSPLPFAVVTATLDAEPNVPTLPLTVASVAAADPGPIAVTSPVRAVMPSVPAAAKSTQYPLDVAGFSFVFAAMQT